MDDNNVPVPVYLQNSFVMANNRLSEINKPDPKKELKMNGSDSNFPSKDKMKSESDERVIPGKGSIDNSSESEINKQTSTSGLVEKRIPKKSSIENNAPPKAESHKQPLTSSDRTKLSKNHISSLLKGFSKDYGSTPSTLKKGPSLQNDDRKQPPRHISTQAVTWESPNICGWGDCADILRDSKEQSLPSVAEVIMMSRRDSQNRMDVGEEQHNQMKAPPHL